MNIKLITETGATLLKESNVKKIILGENKVSFIDAYDKNRSLQFDNVDYNSFTDTFMFYVNDCPILNTDAKADRLFEQLVEEDYTDDDALIRQDQNDLRYGG